MKRLLAAVGIALYSKAATSAPNIDSVGLDVILRAGFEWEASQSSPMQVRLEPHLHLGLTEAISLRASARTEIDGDNRLGPNGVDLQGYSDWSQPMKIRDSATAELRDLFLDIDGDKFNWRLGKQQIVWGQLDGLKILDAVNPQNFREFILEDFGDSRIGLWAVNGELDLGSWAVQLVWAPDPTVHEAPEPSANFAFQAPRFRFGAATGSPSLRGETERSNSTLHDAVYGLRLSTLTANGWDLALSALSGLDPEPLGRIEADPTEAKLIRFHRRREIFGIAAAKSFDSLAWRIEVGLRPKRHFNTRSDAGLLETVERDQFTLGLAADFDGPGGWFTSTQLIYDRIGDAPDELVRSADETILTAFTRRKFRYDTFALEFRWYGTEAGDNGLCRASIEYLISDQTRLSVGADVFYGKENGLFGQFDRRDRILAELRWSL